MNTLIIPVAGQSSRFPGMRPKWLLTMPDGKLMIEKSVEVMDLSCFDRIMVVCLREHIERYSSYDHLLDLLHKGIGPCVELAVLEAPTNSQVETIALGLEMGNVTGSFFIKDCDNLFAYEYLGGNEVAVVDLHSVGEVNAANKSYVQTDPMGVITNIAEKHVIGNMFCCGGYGFSDVQLFLQHWEKLRPQGNLYLSHVIYSMILDGTEFQARQAHKYLDWGTLKDYRSYCDRHHVVFCDVDGVLFQNSSKFSPKGWTYTPLTKNIEALKELRAKGFLYLVVTTSRPPAEQQRLAEELAALGLAADQFVMGLPHTARVLINDHSTTNPYPSAIAINIARDADVLDQMLERTRF
jgi:hypothetical protein